MIAGITGAGVVSLHHDISTRTGEEVVLFTLQESPICRELKSISRIDAGRQAAATGIVAPIARFSASTSGESRYSEAVQSARGR